MSSQPNPDSIEVPPVSPDERAEWEAMKARMADGDESGLIPWDDLAPSLAFRVLAVDRFAVELRNAPGELRGYVSAVSRSWRKAGTSTRPSSPAGGGS